MTSLPPLIRMRVGVIIMYFRIIIAGRKGEEDFVVFFLNINFLKNYYLDWRREGYV